MKKSLFFIGIIGMSIWNIVASDRPSNFFQSIATLQEQIEAERTRHGMIEEIHESIAASTWYQYPTYDKDKLAALYAETPYEEPCTRQNLNCCAKCYVQLRLKGYGCEHVNLFNGAVQGTISIPLIIYAALFPGCNSITLATSCAAGSALTLALSHRNKKTTKELDLNKSNPENWPPTKSHDNSLTMDEEF